MKINTGLYGVFYKDGDEWRGPIEGDVFTLAEIGDEETIELFLKQYAKQRKKKVALFKQVWKSVE